MPSVPKPTYTDVPFWVARNMIQDQDINWTDNGFENAAAINIKNDTEAPPEWMRDFFAHNRSSPSVFSASTKYVNAKIGFNVANPPDQGTQLVALLNHNFADKTGGVGVKIETDLTAGAPGDSYPAAVTVHDFGTVTTTQHLIATPDPYFTDIERIRIVLDLSVGTPDPLFQPRIGEFFVGEFLQMTHGPLQPFDEDEQRSEFATQVSLSGVERRYLHHVKKAHFEYRFRLGDAAEATTLRDVYRLTGGGQRAAILTPNPETAPSRSFLVTVPNRQFLPNTAGLLMRDVNFPCTELPPFRGTLSPLP